MDIFACVMGEAYSLHYIKFLHKASSRDLDVRLVQSLKWQLLGASVPFFCTCLYNFTNLAPPVLLQEERATRTREIEREKHENEKDTEKGKEIERHSERANEK